MDMMRPRFFASAQNDNLRATLCHSEKCNDEESRVLGIATVDLMGMIRQKPMGD